MCADEFFFVPDEKKHSMPPLKVGQPDNVNWKFLETKTKKQTTLVKKYTR